MNKILEMPYLVARFIAFNNMHPVKAWRAYLRVSLDELSRLSSISVFELERIETSNLHFKNKTKQIISEALNISQALLDIRYVSVEEESISSLSSSHEKITRRAGEKRTISQNVGTV